MKTMTNYRIPDDKIWRVLNVSGGRTSAFLLCQVLEAHNGKLPDRTVAIFTNTGHEHPETYRFVERLQSELNVRIIWLEYLWRPDAKGGRADPKHHIQVVNSNSCARQGEPFTALFNSRRRLPGVKRRICTAALKVLPVEHYMRRIKGVSKFRSIIGLRYDERRRWRKLLWEPQGCNTELPLVYQQVTKHQVAEFWKAQSFDLGIPSEWSNCMLCFLKSERTLLDFIRKHPGASHWWEEREAENLQFRKLVNPEKYRESPNIAQFRIHRSYRELREIAEASPELDLGEESDPSLRPNPACFCTD